MASTLSPAEGTLVAQEKAKLQKVLGRLDLVLFTACAIVGLDSVAFAAQAGAAGDHLARDLGGVVSRPLRDAHG